ncbi:MAG: fructose-bisphosphatase class III [Ruminococcaceae bacterium]|nr:fructose-bisphosphatase class III [Oscillospiraceae bacterium]
MTYVMSDIHGHYEKYLAMLEKIAFSEDDTLYVLGDVLDRGPKPTELLYDMSLRANVIPLLGNHEMMASVLLRRLCVEITEENAETQITADLLQSILSWRENGGDTTLAGFRGLPPEEREALLDYLDEFLPYEILEVGGNRFVLVHGGIPYENRRTPLSEQSLLTLTEHRPDYLLRYYDHAYLVTGHTPTLHIGGACAGKIYCGHGHIAIDCGAGFGMPLGCIRLDDFHEFYV